MKKLFLFLTLATLLLSCKTHTVSIISSNKSIVTQKAQSELIKYLSQIYPTVKFTPSSSSKEGIILLLAEDFASEDTADFKLPDSEEAYKIFNKNGALYIVGASDKGLLNGVYALLEHKGCGFYISGDIAPKAQEWNGIDNSWCMEDMPLAKSRYLFNWHNFISGCTGWNLDDWKGWIDNASKMRYNAIMVHAYGNNPMFTFDYMGEQKATGYTNNTISGREWGNQHINDVRRMVGGEIFPNSSYGADHSFASEQNKVQEATSLMQKVFEYADSSATDVIFALDMDTWMSNPQNIISKMPKESLLKVDKYLTPNPEHPIGYQYYKSQLKSLMTTYPSIDELTVWSRTPSGKVFSGLGTIWMMFPYKDFPLEWQKEYKAIINKNQPWLKDDLRSQGSFAFSKIVKAVQKASKELGYNITIGYGSWGWEWIKVVDVFMPNDVPFRPLDTSMAIDNSRFTNLFTEVTSHRTIYPIVWANHDDYAYLGRPFIPYKNLADMLKTRGLDGLGVIHWTTHPLDLYFSSTSKQMWKSSANIDYQKVIDRFVLDRFGEKCEILSAYYHEWATNGAIFGRETSDHMVDLDKLFWRYSFKSWDIPIEPAKKRIEMLDKTPKHLRNNYWKYQRAMEEFYILFCQNQLAFTNTLKIINENGDLDKAQKTIANTTPNEAVAKFVEAIKYIPYSPGEEALVISLNSRWMVDFINLKQRVALEDIYVRFAPTKHDKLAQMPGHNSYHIDKQGNWQIVWWEAEQSKNSFKMVGDRGAAIASSTLDMAITTMHKNELAAAKYTLTIDCNKLHEASLAVIANGKEIASADFNGKNSSVTFTHTKGELSLRIKAKNQNIELYSYKVSVTK